MLSRLSKTRKVLLILLIALMPIGLIKTDYYFMSPGPPYQWEIDYDTLDNYPFEGNLYQLTVRRDEANICLLYTSPSPRDATLSRMPSSA